MAAYTTIDDPEAYFQVVTYTGNGSADHAITLPGDTAMQPDIVWIKNRDATDNHCLFDAVRGVTKVIHPNIESGGEEATDTDTLDAFQTDGFRVDADVKVNTNTEKYVAWCWKANGAGSANSDGSITTTATSANTTSGVSIVKYTGTGSEATLGHGTGIVPKFIVTRSLAVVRDWLPNHTGFDNLQGRVYFNSSAAEYNETDAYGDTANTSSVWEVLTDVKVNGSSEVYISYLFGDVQGFAKHGSFEGNGNADGTFVYLGFRPAWVMTKSIDSTSAWHIFDNKREGYNADNDALEVNDTTVEATADQIDLLSNGFKCRIATDPNVAETYLYSAFAEAPFVNSNGVPCNAR
jgi:hypothetical protein